MDGIATKIFFDDTLVQKIKKKLPKMFYLAELESSRAGKVGMEVGSLRERIIIAMLIHKFGENNVETAIPITEKEIDVKVLGHPISIKTLTGKGYSGFKIIWTVDADCAREFCSNYLPFCDIIFVRINWYAFGAFYYIPVDLQNKIFRKLGRENYLKLPKPGTNPRGIEISSKALKTLLNDDGVYKIPIEWKKEKIEYDAYERWVELWEQEL
jgi:hypothetical protein